MESENNLEEKNEKSLDLEEKRDKTKDFETSSIEIGGKTVPVFNGFFNLYIFCFFCGQSLGPAKNDGHLRKLAKEKNFKHRPHFDFEGRRWMCVKCRRLNREIIDLALKKEENK